MDDFLTDRMLAAGFELTEHQVAQFLTFYEMLMEWNQVMNLTAITEFGDVVVKHFVDSVMVGKIFGWNADVSFRMMDLGTGAGFPGIPLKILYPELQVLLMDSLNKRVRFLQAVIEKLELEKIEAVHGRAEEFGRKDAYRQQFDLCVSRAVANLSSLAEFCLPYVKVGGRFVSYKAGHVEEELGQAKGAIRILGGTVKTVETFFLPGSDIERTLICIEKKHDTPGKYPRQGGKPLKEPLG